jgi:hypothetical protein
MRLSWRRRSFCFGCRLIRLRRFCETAGLAVLFTVERVQVTDLPVDDKHVTGLELKLGSRVGHQLGVGAPDQQRHRRAA